MESKIRCCGAENMGTGFYPCTSSCKKTAAWISAGLMMIGIFTWLIKMIYHL